MGQFCGRTQATEMEKKDSLRERTRERGDVKGKATCPNLQRKCSKIYQTKHAQGEDKIIRKARPAATQI